MTLSQMGIKIKQLRLRQQKTQQEIADECGISKSLLSKIENGQTSSAIATLSKISKELDVPLAWLLEDTPEQSLVIQTKNERSSKVGGVRSEERRVGKERRATWTEQRQRQDRNR